MTNSQNNPTQQNMFAASCSDLPLFSGTCQRVTIAPFAPTAAPARQLTLAGVDLTPSAASQPAAALPVEDLPLFAQTAPSAPAVNPNDPCVIAYGLAVIAAAEIVKISPNMGKYAARKVAYLSAQSDRDELARVLSDLQFIVSTIERKAAR